MGNNFQKKNQTQEDKACEKIFKAVRSPLRKGRRFSKRNQRSDSVKKTRQNPEAVHVKLAETSAQTGKHMSRIEPSGKNKKTVTRADTVKTDEQFTDYIKRAKLRIRAMTNLSDIMKADATETETETHVPVYVSKDSGRDQFSEYIKKAKMKLRASSVGHGNPNHDSFKHVKN